MVGRLNDPSRTVSSGEPVTRPQSHCVFCGIADHRCYTPTSFRRTIACRDSKTGLEGGGCSKKLALKPIAGLGGIA